MVMLFCLFGCEGFGVVVVGEIDELRFEVFVVVEGIVALTDNEENSKLGNVSV